MAVSGNSIAGKGFQSFQVNEGLLQKVTEAVEKGEQQARSSGDVKSFEVFYHGFRQNIAIGRIYIVPASVCDKPEDFPVALLYGTVVRVLDLGEETADLITVKSGDAYDESEDAKEHLKDLKQKVFITEDGKSVSLVVFAPAWAGIREYVAFRFTDETERLTSLLRHLVFSCYFNPAVSSGFDALMTKVDTTKLNVTDITPKLTYPGITESPLKAYPDLAKAASAKPKKICLTAKTAEGITKSILEPDELNVFQALEDALGGVLKPEVRQPIDVAEPEYKKPEADAKVPRSDDGTGPTPSTASSEPGKAEKKTQKEAVKKEAATYPFDVFIGSKWVNRVFYNSPEDPEDVKRSLVSHDGYHPSIEVKPGGNGRIPPGEAWTEEEIQAGRRRPRVAGYVVKQGRRAVAGPASMEACIGWVMDHSDHRMASRGEYEVEKVAEMVSKSMPSTPMTPEEIFAQENYVGGMGDAGEAVSEQDEVECRVPKEYRERCYASGKAKTADMDPFLASYIETALWSSNDGSDEQGGDPMEWNYGVNDIAPESIAKMKRDCDRFQAEDAELIRKAMSEDGMTADRIAHDFWLTRNHHGAGFWDGDYPVTGEALTEASREFGEANLYVGDDGKIYQYSDNSEGVVTGEDIMNTPGGIQASKKKADTADNPANQTKDGEGAMDPKTDREKPVTASRSYQPRFIRSADEGELVNLYHLARTALSGQKAGHYERMLWASKEFSKAHPEVSATAAYKDLDGLLSGTVHYFSVASVRYGRVRVASSQANFLKVIGPKKQGAMSKVAYVVHCKGHKNSKGEIAEWCIKSHETGKILSSHTSEAAARKHLQDMHAHSGSGKGAAGAHPAGCACGFCEKKGDIGKKEEEKDEKKEASAKKADTADNPANEAGGKADIVHPKTDAEKANTRGTEPELAPDKNPGSKSAANVYEASRLPLSMKKIITLTKDAVKKDPHGIDHVVSNIKKTAVAIMKCPWCKQNTARKECPEDPQYRCPCGWVSASPKSADEAKPKTAAELVADEIARPIDEDENTISAKCMMAAEKGEKRLAKLRPFKVADDVDGDIFKEAVGELPVKVVGDGKLAAEGDINISISTDGGKSKVKSKLPLGDGPEKDEKGDKKESKAKEKSDKGKDKKADLVTPDINSAREKLDHGAKECLADNPDATKTEDASKFAASKPLSMYCGNCKTETAHKREPRSLAGSSRYVCLNCGFLHYDNATQVSQGEFISPKALEYIKKTADQSVVPDITQAKSELDHGAKPQLADSLEATKTTDARELGKQADGKYKCRWCDGQSDTGNVCSEKCRKEMNAEMAKGDYASPEEMRKQTGKGGRKKTAYEPGAQSGIRGQDTAKYIYRADVYCEGCAKWIAERLDAEGKRPMDPMDEKSYDSDDYPKGPFFGEESDFPDHCRACGKFLENPLTQDGYRYLREMVSEAEAEGRGNEPYILEWKAFYPEAFEEDSRIASKQACAPLGDDRDETLEMEVDFGSLADLGVNLPEIAWETVDAPQVGEGGLNNEPPANKEAAAKTAVSREALDLAQMFIDDEDELVYDVCANHGQIFDNVKHMSWLRKAVAEEIEAEGILGEPAGQETGDTMPSEILPAAV